MKLNQNEERRKQEKLPIQIIGTIHIYKYINLHTRYTLYIEGTTH